MDAQLTVYAQKLLLTALVTGFCGGVLLCWGKHVGSVAYALLLDRLHGWRHRVAVSQWEAGPEAAEARQEARRDWFQALAYREQAAEMDRLEVAWAASPEGRAFASCREAGGVVLDDGADDVRAEYGRFYCFHAEEKEN